VDTRLRPDGSKGLLVSSLESFTGYQKSRAWTWEHQALLRARPIAGDSALHAELAAVRREVLAVPRDRASVLREVSSMRQRWRAERDRSDDIQFDIKQGLGGLLDIEFALQGLVLAHASGHPSLLNATANAALIEACRNVGLLDGRQAGLLAEAHAVLLHRALACTLDLRSRIAPRDAELERLSGQVQEVTTELGFAF
jgi:glutamate-ammonia-ligase adenylyltransferase